jgi:hypothetical protein
VTAVATRFQEYQRGHRNCAGEFHRSSCFNPFPSLTCFAEAFWRPYKRLLPNLQFIPDGKHIVFGLFSPGVAGSFLLSCGNKAHPLTANVAYGRTPHRNRLGSTPAQTQRQCGKPAARQSGRAHCGVSRRRKGHPRRDALSAAREREKSCRRHIPYWVC